MANLHISAEFDAGNIRVVCCDDSCNIRLQINPDPFTEKDGRCHFQWFYFQVSGAAGLPLTMHITNAGEASYPSAWSSYQAVATSDMRHWFRIQQTSYDETTGVLTIQHTPQHNCVRYAYFAPYSLEQHAQLVMSMQDRPGVTLRLLGSTLDGRDLHMLQVGHHEPGDKVVIWVICRQHPGEPMAEWFAEGLLERLTHPAADKDVEVQQLLQQAVLYVVPNMNPDGSFRGHLRTNAAGANLNREWDGPSSSYSPEVAAVSKAMEATGLDMLLDVHGDEEIPANFIGSMFGIPAWGPRLERMQNAFVDALLAASPDFQTKLGYPLPPPNGANLSTASKANAQKYNTLSLVLEQPFKDTIDNPVEGTGWSPERAKAFGAAHVTAFLNTVPTLLKERATKETQE